MDDPYDESRLLQSIKYRPYFDKFQNLKEKLSAINASISPHKSDQKREKALESEFLDALNHFVADLNLFCSATVTEIRESLNFITRKLSVEQKVDPKIHPLLSDEVDNEAGEIVRLDQFVQLMQDALLELIQRHDSLVGLSSFAWFSARLQGEKFTNINFCALIMLLSDVYSSIRSGLRVHQVPFTPSSQYKTRTAKFWIRRSDVNKVKVILSKHLPVRVWNEEGNIPWEDITDSRKYTSIYVDSDKFDLYTAIRSEANGASQIRVEWYDDDEAHTVIEQKIYRDWFTNSTTNKSIPIKNKRLGQYLKGEWTYDADSKKILSKKKMSQEQYDERLKIANQLQTLATEKELKPVLRVEYQRSGFQDSNRSPELRITIDDDLVLTREKMEKGKWLKTVTVAPKDRIEFPFAIFQIKYLDKCPSWIENLERGPVLIPIEGHFSKFLYGISKFYAEQLETLGLSLPKWFPSIEKTHQQLKKKPGHLLFQPETRTTDPMEIRHGMTYIMSATSEDEGNFTETGEDEGAVRMGRVETKRHRYNIDNDEDNEPLIPEKDKAPLPPQRSKDIKPDIRPQRPPIKVEPKTFFANERTLLQWLNAIVLLATVSIALIGLGNGPSRISGIILLPIAIFFALYALVMYHFRRTSIKKHKPTSTYDDRFGPYAIVFVFVGAVIASAVVPLVHTEGPPIDYNRAYYPFYPAKLPFVPEEAILSAPLPISAFANRSIGLASMREYLNSLSATQKFYFDNLSTNEKLYEVTFYKSSQKNISSYFTLSRMASGKESDTFFNLYSTIPQFRNLPPPQVRPGTEGKDLYQLSMTCTDYEFYHQSIVYNMPDDVDSFRSLDYYLSYVIEDLKVSPDVTIKVDNNPPYKSIYKWSADAEIDTVVSLISISIYYDTLDPGDDTEPVSASFEISFSDGSNVMRGSVFARSMLSQLIYDKFQLWPDECVRQNKNNKI